MMKFIAVFVVIISTSAFGSGLTNVPEDFNGEIVNVSVKSSPVATGASLLPNATSVLTLEGLVRLTESQKALVRQAAGHIEQGNWQKAIESSTPVVNEASWYTGGYT